MIVRLSYLVPFWFFLFALYKLIREFLDKKSTMIFISSVATFPILLLASTTPDHSIWSCLVFTYLLFYVINNEKKKFLLFQKLFEFDKNININCNKVIQFTYFLCNTKKKHRL